ncbi:DUF1819 family protein [Bacillus methanolicus]|nr:DUF1819 family protein [Bacillus methanolicus]
MKIDLEYSSALTGASFLFFEMKKVVELSIQELSEKEIRKKVIDENLFEYKHTSSLKRSLPSLLRRVNALDYVLKQRLLEDSLETGKIINLYAIMKTDRLFFEFMNEVISEKLADQDFQLEKKDINLYFSSKAEQSPVVAKFTEQTVRKLQQVHQRILQEAGILVDPKSGKLAYPIIDTDLQYYLRSIGDEAYLKAMGVE